VDLLPQDGGTFRRILKSDAGTDFRDDHRYYEIPKIEYYFSQELAMAGFAITLSQSFVSSRARTLSLLFQRSGPAPMVLLLEGGRVGRCQAFLLPADYRAIRFPVVGTASTMSSTDA